MTTAMDDLILTVNCGSSSLKFSLYQRVPLTLQISGSISQVGSPECVFELSDNENKKLEAKKIPGTDINGAVSYVIAWLKTNNNKFAVTAIGHRFVQGGPNHRNPEILTNELLRELQSFIYLAPNHLPAAIKIVEVFRDAFPKLTQIACFDTAFHQYMPTYVKCYPLPKEYQKPELIKYGFHGLSYTYILQKLIAEKINLKTQKIIIAHLGNGASMAAVKNGISIDTTMGLSPIGGLVMGTRSGDLDPGVLLYLIKQYKVSVNQLDDLLSKKSGLIAIAGTSDMMELLSAEQSDDKAKEAITVFCYQVKKTVGALAAAMGGLDLLVFTGGIGANSALIRQYICDDLGFLGIALSKPLNEAGKNIISLRTSRIAVRAIKTDEEIIIAQSVQTILTTS